MATIKAVVRKQRADGFYPVYIRIGHRAQKGYIKTDKIISPKHIASNGDFGTSRSFGAYVKMGRGEVLKFQAYSLTGRKMKKFLSRTPLICALKIFTLELKASAGALVALRRK